MPAGAKCLEKWLTFEVGAPMGEAMRWFTLGVAFAFAAGLSSAAYPRLVGQSVQGVQRICIYDGATGHDGINRRRLARTGIGQACPATFPEQRRGDGFPPSSAMLQSERVENGNRLCAYEQLGYVWERSISVRTPCPPAAGMLPPDGQPSANAR